MESFINRISSSICVFFGQIFKCHSIQHLIWREKTKLFLVKTWLLLHLLIVLGDIEKIFNLPSEAIKKTYVLQLFEVWLGLRNEILYKHFCIVPSGKHVAIIICRQKLPFQKFM